MHHHGFSGPISGDAGANSTAVVFDWDYLRGRRDAYVERLNVMYENNLMGSGVDMLRGTARLERDGDGGVVVGVSTEETGTTDAPTRYYVARHVLLATGGRPTMPDDVIGVNDHAITSDGFFDLAHLPKKVVIIGGGYIAVELAGILSALGSNTSLVLRRERALRDMDEMLSDTLDVEMKRRGIRVHANTNGVDRIESGVGGCEDGGMMNETSRSTKVVYLNDGTTIACVDVVVMAVGRSPSVELLNLAEVGVMQKEEGGDASSYVVTNEYSETTVEGVYAVGDITGNVELTPMGECHPFPTRLVCMYSP